MMYENRHARRARQALERRASRRRFVDTREGVANDLTTITLHPTKGFRRISGRRILAQQYMAVAYG